MNHSINYSGFIDLVVTDNASIAASMDTATTDDCKPAISVQPYKSEELEELVGGVALHSPNKNR